MKIFRRYVKKTIKKMWEDFKCSYKENPITFILDTVILFPLLFILLPIIIITEYSSSEFLEKEEKELKETLDYRERLLNDELENI